MPGGRGFLEDTEGWPAWQSTESGMLKLSVVGQTWDVSHHHENSRRCEGEGATREVPYSNACFLKFSLALVWGTDMAEGGRSGGGEVCEEI